MKYLILIYGDEQRWAERSPHERQRIEDGHAAFRDAVGAGLLGGRELRASSTATTLRAGSADRPAVTDGPFLETKEGLGGYYVIEATDLDEAISLAGRLPELGEDASAAVEIRPVVEPG